jgi:hypothetical protein
MQCVGLTSQIRGIATFEKSSSVEWLAPFEEVRGLTRCFCYNVESISGTSKNLFHCITQGILFLALQPNQAARDLDFRFAFGLAILKSLDNFSPN